MNNLSVNTIASGHSEANVISVEQTLLEVRSTRRLEQVVLSIQRFLENQVTRFEQAIDQCEGAVENDSKLQILRAEFDAEKQAWQEAIKKEVTRLNEASESLTNGWQQLEDERRNWIDNRGKNKDR